MFVYWAILFIIACFAVKNWKATTVVWLPLQLLFNECVCLKYDPPALTLVLAVDFLLFFVYLFQHKHLKVDNEKFLFKEIFIVYLISYGLSMAFSIMPFSEILTNTIKYFIQCFLILFLFQKALTNNSYIKIYFQITFIVAVLSVLLGLYEVATGDNPILDYVYINAPEESIKGKMYYIPPFASSGERLARYGMYRAYSFYTIHIEFGCTCLFLLFFYMYLYKYKVLRNTSQLKIGMCILLIGVILSNSKTPLIGLLFFVCAYLSLKNLLNFKTILFFILIVSIIAVYFPGYLNNFIALFDEKVADDGQGSTAVMRIRQFEIAFRLFKQSPIVGNGVGSIGYFMQNIFNSDLLGSESSWLKILPERGFVGVVAYLYLFISIYKKMKNCMDRQTLIFFLIGLMIMEAATGFMNMALYGSILIVIHKYKTLNKNKELLLSYTNKRTNI